jgi:hypothetical protein
VIIATVTRTDSALADGAGHATALTAGYRLGFLIVAALLLLGAVVSTALPSRGR